METELPDFIAQDESTSLITIGEASIDDIGIHCIIIYSALANSLLTKTSTTFCITVFEPSGITVAVRPEFILNVSNQRVAVGSSLVYSPGFATNTYGF